MLAATCHCGAVRVEVPRKPRRLTDCNCSICRRYVGLWAYYKASEVRVTSAPGATRDYCRPIDAVWSHPIMGGSPLIAAPFLAVLGSVALSVGTATAAIALKRTGASWGPVLLLAISGSGIGIFKTHAWPGGPLTFGGIAVAAAWLLWVQNRSRRRERPEAAQ